MRSYTGILQYENLSHFSRAFLKSEKKNLKNLKKSQKSLEKSHDIYIFVTLFRVICPSVVWRNTYTPSVRFPSFSDLWILMKIPLSLGL